MTARSAAVALCAGRGACAATAEPATADDGARGAGGIPARKTLAHGIPARGIPARGIPARRIPARRIVMRGIVMRGIVTRRIVARGAAPAALPRRLLLTSGRDHTLTPGARDCISDAGGDVEGCNLGRLTFAPLATTASALRCPPAGEHMRSTCPG